MSVHLHIERLVVEGLDLATADAPYLAAAIEAELVARLAADWAPAAELVCLTCSERGVVASHGGEIVSRSAVRAEPVDRFGAGDAFVAGLLDALLRGEDAGDAIAFGCGLAALKTTVPGDMSPFGRADVEAIVAGEVLRR